MVQQAAPDGYTRSITFLSAGYLETEENDFNTDVDYVLAALSNYSTGVLSDPWPRYAAQFNFYAVFQPSGVSGFSAGNNLECSVSNGDVTYPSCSVPLVTSLATYAPAEDIILVIVHSSRAVGTGGNGIAVVTNLQEYLPVLAVHYLNRAIANLSEEYNEGFNGAPRAQLPNCAESVEDASTRWSYWYNEMLEDDEINPILNGAGCTFSSYTAPTANQCLMRSTSLNTMCPICREQLNLAFFGGGVSDGYAQHPTTSPLSLSADQCPPSHHSIVASGIVVLYAGSFSIQNDVVVTWYNSDGTKLGTGAYLQPDVSAITAETVIKAVYTDNSPYVQPTKRDTLTSVIEFRLVPSAPSGVTPAAPECYASLSDPPATATATTYCPDGTQCGSATPKKTIPEDMGAGEKYTRLPLRRSDFVLPVSIASGTSFVLWLLITVIFIVHFRRAPREVLDITTTDFAMIVVITSLTTVLWIFAIFSIGVANARKHREVVVFLPVCRTTLILCSVTIGVCVANYISVLMRWYIMCAACAVTGAAVGITLFVFGVFTILGTAASSSRQFQSMLYKRWNLGVQQNENIMCPFQRRYECSGYYASCFELESTSCIPGCNANFYMAPCGPYFTQIFKEQYSPIDALILVVSCLLILVAALNAIYFMRFRQISANGKFSRSFRSNPHPPVLPVTFNEASRARRYFEYATRNTNGKMKGKAAIAFLECIFDGPVQEEEREKLQEMGEMGFDELMLLYFPYAQTSQMDPRMLTPDEAEGTSEMLQLERKQYKRLEEFQEAAGCLSPEELQELFQKHFSTVFMPSKEEILEKIREAAKTCADAPMCRGLSRAELEGLRGLWVAVHPSISGFLTDPELEVLYNFTHDDKCRSVEQLLEWRTTLDVRGNDKKVGWGEFCYPFAQKALLRDARDYLKAVECEIPPEMVPKLFAVERFGDSILSTFLPYEQEIPIERLVATIMRRWSDNPLHEKDLFDKDVYHATELHGREEVRWKKKEKKKEKAKEKED